MHNKHVSNTIVVCVTMISLTCLLTLTIIAITFGLLAFVFPNIWMLKAAILTGPVLVDLWLFDLTCDPTWRTYLRYICQSGWIGEEHAWITRSVVRVERRVQKKHDLKVSYMTPVAWKWISRFGTIKCYCIVLYCIVLYCIVLYCIVLYCIVLYCIVYPGYLPTIVGPYQCFWQLPKQHVVFTLYILFYNGSCAKIEWVTLWSISYCIHQDMCQYYSRIYTDIIVILVVTFRAWLLTLNQDCWSSVMV